MMKWREQTPREAAEGLCPGRASECRLHSRKNGKTQGRQIPVRTSFEEGGRKSRKKKKERNTSFWGARKGKKNKLGRRQNHHCNRRGNCEEKKKKQTRGVPSNSDDTVRGKGPRIPQEVMLCETNFFSGSSINSERYRQGRKPPSK